MSKYVYGFNPDLQNNTAAAIYHAARAGGPTVLDIGSGPGIIASYLATQDGRTVTCVDYDAEALDSARERGVSTTHVVDLREDTWYLPLKGSSFDVVVLADVLEHLVDPERVLADIRREKLVTDDGHLVVSMPNANHEAVIVELVTGHFDYTETGLLDRTHLRFFTFDSMRSLLEAAGFLVTEVHRTLQPLEMTRQRIRAPEVSPTLKAAIEELGIESRTFQYVLQARPMTEQARILELSGQLDGHRADVQQHRVLAEKAQAQAETGKQAQAELARVRAELAEVRSELAGCRSELKARTKELATIRSSTTWRAGRAVVRLGSPLRGLRR